ncbi:MAG TPA: hypothetical protein VG456_02005 [Candidatus Sulfopaludibacter sp.]|jgi:hypothetical protein|nr:hypothetical protein [Candidatus Sulfopaludibacter sp.]
MADRIPAHHLVVIAAAATAAVNETKDDRPQWKAPVKIRIRMPIVIRPRKTAEPAAPEPEKKDTP